jgi:hypothetical protein
LWVLATAALFFIDLLAPRAPAMNQSRFCLYGHSVMFFASLL